MELELELESGIGDWSWKMVNGGCSINLYMNEIFDVKKRETIRSINKCMHVSNVYPRHFIIPITTTTYLPPAAIKIQRPFFKHTRHRTQQLPYPNQETTTAPTLDVGENNPEIEAISYLLSEMFIELKSLWTNRIQPAKKKEFLVPVRTNTTSASLPLFSLGRRQQLE